MNDRMDKPLRFEPPPDFADPRLAPEFQPEHWPRCNGESAPPLGIADLHERRCVEFLAGFYRLNVLNSRLLAARTNAATGTEIRLALDKIAAATTALEHLEDRYAPIGFFGEPVMDGVFYRNILFVRPELPRILPQAASVSSHVAIPGLEEIPESELQGQVTIRRWNHGKVGV